MTIWYDVDGANSRVAVYTGDDDAPMAAPRANLGRTKLHTDFNYLPFIPAKKLTATVVAVASITDVARGPMRRTINLGPHGMEGVPFIYGFATIGGIIRPMCGTIPVRVAASRGTLVHWTLGVNETNVFISEGRSYPIWTSSTSALVEVYISKKLVI